MKIINLDQFKQQTMVSIDEVVYTIDARTVEDFINSDYDKKLAAAQTPSEQFKVIVEELIKIISIPKEILVKQQVNVLNAILQIINGVDPEAEQDEDAKKDSEKK